MLCAQRGPSPSVAGSTVAHEPPRQPPRRMMFRVPVHGGTLSATSLDLLHLGRVLLPLVVLFRVPRVGVREVVAEGVGVLCGMLDDLRT